MSSIDPIPSRTVLLVAANALVRDFVRKALEGHGFELVEHAAGENALDALETAPCAALIVDLEVADSFACIARARRHDAELPIVALAGGVSIDRALDAGASDCCTPPLHPTLLVRRIETLAAGRAHRGAGTAAAPALAHVDAFLAHIGERLARTKDKRRSALFVVALDREDVIGGDLSADDARETAEAAALALKDTLRQRDAGGKSGEPNVALLDGARIAVHLDGFERPLEAYKVAQRIQERLEPAIDVRGARAGVMASVGIALSPEDGADGAALLASAERAASIARNEPHGALRFATQSTNSAVFARLSLEKDLCRALERDELCVYYQPRVDVKTGRVRGVEALVRWKHPTLGMVSPAQFIPLAEECGLIVPVGRFVLRAACAQNRRWRDQGLPPITVAVNVSSVQLRDGVLQSDVESALHAARLSADALELELTESSLLETADATVAALEAITDLGVKLAIDDFGTGYSNFSYIKRFPVDALKIDQSFVREITSNPEDAAVTTSIVLMAKSLGLVTVAEGVETRSQLALLAALECDEAQGFLFSRPLPGDEVGPLIARGFPSCAAA